VAAVAVMMAVMTVAALGLAGCVSAPDYAARMSEEFVSPRRRRTERHCPRRIPVRAG